MKLKQKPEDFVVTELGAPPLEGGRYSVYRLSKKGIGTIEAVNQIARRLGIPRRSFGFGGLKDKWASAEQHLSIEGGPEEGFRSERWELVYLGRSKLPVRRGSFEKNRFSITIRDLWEGDVRHLGHALDQIRADGLPNYYDSQRFGSAEGAEDFIARRLLRRDFEGALRLALSSVSPHDKSPAKRAKRTLQERWGEWEACLEKLPSGAFQAPVVRFLAKNPGAWAKAFGLIDPALRLLYASAYQSFLWNRILAELIGRFPPSLLFRKAYAMGQLLFYRRLPASGRERMLRLEIPLPRRGVEPDDPEVASAASKVLAEEGLALADLKIRGGSYFGRGSRRAIVIPEALSLGDPEPDELNPGRLKVRLSFELPRGSYATSLVKRIFH